MRTDKLFVHPAYWLSVSAAFALVPPMGLIGWIWSPWAAWVALMCFIGAVSTFFGACAFIAVCIKWHDGDFDKPRP